MTMMPVLNIDDLIAELQTLASTSETLDDFSNSGANSYLNLSALAVQDQIMVAERIEVAVNEKLQSLSNQVSNPTESESTEKTETADEGSDLSASPAEMDWTWTENDDPLTEGEVESGPETVVSYSGLFLVNQVTQEVIGPLEEMNEEEIADLANGILTVDHCGVNTSTETGDFTTFYSASTVASEDTALEYPTSDSFDFGDFSDSTPDMSEISPGDETLDNDVPPDYFGLGSTAENNAAGRFDEAANKQLNELNEITDDLYMM